jgi:adenylate kinase
VIELKVNEGMLLDRIEKRIAEMKARGEPLRPDDNPDVLRRRLLAYRDQTAPLVAYYQLQSVLRSIDGMAPIPEVAGAIDRLLLAPSTKNQSVKGQVQAPAKAAAKKPAGASGGGAGVPSVTTKAKPTAGQGKKNKAKQGTKPAGAGSAARKAPKRKAKSSARAASGRKAPPRKTRQQRLTKPR